MPLERIPAAFMRGGTSKGVMFLREHLPADPRDWDPIFLRVMGSPDPYGRQLDGMGGGLSSLSKVCVVGPPSRANADIDFTFAQVSIHEARVDYGGNCGNMSSAVGPFALDEGLLAAEGREATIRIHNTNTSKIIIARFPVEEGRLAAGGDMELDGVPGNAASIRLEFLEPGGAKTGRLLPSGRTLDVFEVDGVGPVEVTCIDAANPCVFVAAERLGKSGGEFPDELGADAAFLARMEAIRRKASVAMGMAADEEAAGCIVAVPKVAIVSAPSSGRTLSGLELASGRSSIGIRMISVGQPHLAVPVTGAICLAVACRVPGSVPNTLSTAPEGPIAIAHPSGVTFVDAQMRSDLSLPGGVAAVHGAIYRTARRLFEGNVVFTPKTPP